MTTNKKCLLVTVCAAAALIVGAVSLADADKPSKDSSAANTKAEAKILSVLEEMSKNRNYAMWNITTEEGRLLWVLTAAAGAYCAWLCGQLGAS